MGSSSTPFLPSAAGGGEQIGAFPTFPAAPLFADEDGLVAVAAFPPLFGFGTFCPEDQQPQPQQQHQQLLVPGEQQQQFLPIQSPFFGDAPLSRFAVDETQLLVNMACGTFLTDCAELQHNNYFPPVPTGQDLPPIFGASNCAGAIAPHSSASLKSELFSKIENIDEQDSKASVHHRQHHLHLPLSTARRGGHPTQRGGMRRRVAERIGKRKGGQSANLLAITQTSSTSSPTTVRVLLKCDENVKNETAAETQPRQLSDDAQFVAADPLKLDAPHATAATTVSPPGYRMPATIVAQEEPKRCAHCNEDIYDRIMLAVGKETPAFFHCKCLKCSECAVPLENEPKCFVRFERIHCEDCYLKSFGICCATCDKVIGRVWVRRAREFFYHVICFKCDHCKRQLGTGDKYSLDDLHHAPPAIPRLLCELHYKELVLGEQSNSKQKTKRVRTTFGEEQLTILQQHFKVDSNPDGADLERIAYLTGLSKRVTQVWFQNSRARQKKGHGHASCRKSVVASLGGAATGSSSTSIASGVGMDTPCLGGCRSATLTPSSAYSSNGARTDGQSPALFGRGGSTGSESDGFRQLFSSAISPSAINGELCSSVDAPPGEISLLQSLKKDEEVPK